MQHEGVLMTRSRWTGLVFVLVAAAYACGSQDKGRNLPDAPIGDARVTDASLSDGPGSGSDPDAGVCCDPGSGSGSDAGPPRLDASVLDARSSAVPGSH
jgi:hypothetical protein